MLGAVGIQLVSVVVNQWISFYYAPPEGVLHRIAFLPLGLVTIMMISGRLLDAFVDPYIGYLSDKTKSRFGRRKPYIIFGCIPLALAFVFLWFPPIQEISIFNFIYGMFFMLLFWFFFAVVVIPYFALLPEIARTTQGRVKLGIFQSIGMSLGLALAFIGSGFLIENFGYKINAIIYAILSVICFEIMAFGVKERYHQEEEKPEEVKFFTQFLTTLKNRPFLIFIISFCLFTLGFFTIQITLPYFIKVVIGGTEADLSKYMAVFTAVGIPTYVVLILLSQKTKINKKTIFGGALLMMSVLFPFMYFIGVYQGPISKYYLGMLVFAFAGIPQIAIYVYYGVLLGECIDLDEIQTGKRREAIYAGIQALTMKLGMTASPLVMWIFFTLFGYSSAQPLGILLIGPIAGFISLVGFIIFAFYPVLHVVKRKDE